MPETCRPECPFSGRVTGAPRAPPLPSKIVKVTVTGTDPGLNAPTLVRKLLPLPSEPFWIDVSTVVACASDSCIPGMNMPTVGVGKVENSRLVTTSWSSGPSKTNSTPPAVFGCRKVAATMSSKARDSRGASVKVDCGAIEGHVNPIAAMKHR